MLLKVSAVREPMSRFGRYLLIMSADGLEVRQKEIMSGRTKVLNRAIVLNRLGGKKQMKEWVWEEMEDGLNTPAKALSLSGSPPWRNHMHYPQEATQVALIGLGSYNT
jgi:hypothetical protein